MSKLIFKLQCNVVRNFSLCDQRTMLIFRTVLITTWDIQPETKYVVARSSYYGAGVFQLKKLVPEYQKKSS